MAQSSPSTEVAQLSELELPQSLRNLVTPQSICEGVIGSGKSSGTLDEFKKSFESGAPLYNTPREAIETMHRGTHCHRVEETK
jgi:hypothetical protein